MNERRLRSGAVSIRRTTTCAFVRPQKSIDRRAGWSLGGRSRRRAARRYYLHPEDDTLALRRDASEDRSPATICSVDRAVRVFCGSRRGGCIDPRRVWSAAYQAHLCHITSQTLSSLSRLICRHRTYGPTLFTSAYPNTSLRIACYH